MNLINTLQQNSLIENSKGGLYHHTSGLYFIQKLTDSIENGVFKTRLTLIKNVATMGNSSLNKYKDNGEKNVRIK